MSHISFKQNPANKDLLNQSDEVSVAAEVDIDVL